MDEISFKHFIQELKDSAATGDAQKLLVQASFFEELSLSQQMEAGVVARQHIKPTLFLNVYRIVLQKKLLARRNVILRKLLKEAFLKDPSCLREAANMVPSDDPVAVDFISLCFTEAGDTAALKEFRERMHIDNDPLSPRVLEIAKLDKLELDGGNSAIEEMANNAGKDVGLDIVMITKLAKFRTVESWRALIAFLGVPTTKVRGYAQTKLEEVGPGCAPILIEELERAIEHPLPDKAIAIFTVLRKVARYEHIKALRKVGRKIPDHINTKVAYLETLNQLDPDGAAPVLMEHICDGVDDIAFTAATMLDAHVNDRIIQGVQNVVDGGLISLKRLVEIVVFSHSKQLASRLSANTVFYESLEGFCSMQGMEEYAVFFGLAEPEIIQKPSIADESVWAVDDSRMILRMYERFGHDAGIRLKTFESGELLLNSLTGKQPELIFLDLNMPGMSGVEIAQKLNDLGWDSVPRVLVTTQEDAVHDEDIRKGLFREIVLKPFTFDNLEKVASRYL